MIKQQQQKGSDPFCHHKRGLTPFVALIFLIFSFCPANAFASGGADLPRAVQQVLAEAGQEMAEGRVPEALERMSRFCDRHPDTRHPLLLFFMANAHLQQRAPEKALPLYREATALSPEDTRIWQNLAIAAYETQALGEAALAMEKAWESCPQKKPSLLYHSGLFHLMDKKPEAAWKKLSLLMTTVEKPEREWVRAYVQAAMETGNEKKGLGVLEKGLERAPEDTLLWELATHLYLRIKDYKKAAAAMEIRMDVAGEAGPEAYRLLGDLYANLNLPARAAEAYGQARKKGDVKSDLFVREVQMLHAARLHEKALARIAEAESSGPDPALSELAMSIHMAENRYKEALEAGVRSLEAGNREKPHLLLTLGYCAYKAGDLKKAESLLSRIPPNDKNRHREARRLLAHLKRESQGL